MDTWVAVAGTLLGALLAGGLQAWSADRARKSAQQDAREQRADARKALDRQLAEERFRRLWDERRAVFVQLLAVADHWRLAISDLRELDLPNRPRSSQPQVQTRRDVVAALPEADEVLGRMEEFGRVAAQVHLLADSEVRGAIDHMQSVLREHMRAATVGDQPEAVGIGEAKQLLLLAMRRELIYGTAADPQDT